MEKWIFSLSLSQRDIRNPEPLMILPRINNIVGGLHAEYFTNIAAKDIKLFLFLSLFLVPGTANLAKRGQETTILKKI